MEPRPVPRNIDAPNRAVEYISAFMLGYYGVQFSFHSPLGSFAAGFVMVYVMYRITLNQPEGIFFRLLHKVLQFGGFLPNPQKAPKLEI